jgi:hypothetical protein
MQSNGFSLMIFIFLALPVIILFSNHDIFFIIIALILIISSIKNLYQTIIKPPDIQSENESIFEDYGEDEDLSSEGMGISARIVKNLVVILFYIYCTFFIYSIAFRAVVLIIILYWLHDTINSPARPTDSTDISTPPIKTNTSVQGALSFFVNIGSILMIIFVTCNKFIKRII